jgi:hypothetical protein
MDQIKKLLAALSPFIDSGKLAGWVRAGVAALLGLIIARSPILGSVLSPEVQSALAVAASGAVVGIWSQITKTDSAKIAAVEALPDVKNVVVEKTATDGVAAAAADPERPKVVVTQ